MSDPSGTMDFLTANFAQLATTQNLQPGSKRYRKAQAQFIVAEFNAYFGEDTKLANWQKLCTDMGIEGPPRSINKCRKALSKVWVNIWDFLSAVRQEQPVAVFHSERELAAYTRRTGKFYPKRLAKQSGPVRALLARVR